MSTLHQSPFRSHPQKYPRAQARAATLAGTLHELVSKGPRTLVATVVDTSFHVSAGYVTATTELGLVRVVGVPYGTVVPQMRILVRLAGPHRTTRSYVFDGYAPTPSLLGGTSGSVMPTMATGNVGVVTVQSSTGAIPTVSTLGGSTGYYWHCFFYLPEIPRPSAVTLLAMTNAGHTTTLVVEYWPSGVLEFRSLADNKGYMTNAPVAPHVPHWLVLQPGLGGGQDVLIDGIPGLYQPIHTGDTPTFAAGGTNYTLTLFTSYDGSGACPLGTWISKLGFGTMPTSASVCPIVPESDADIPNMAVSTMQQTIGLWLCGDSTPQGPTLLNSAAGSLSSGSGENLSVNDFWTTIQTIGPY